MGASLYMLCIQRPEQRNQRPTANDMISQISTYSGLCYCTYANADMHYKRYYIYIYKWWVDYGQ
jgi:hypothetical protein